MLRLVLLRLLESYFRHRWLYLLPIVLMLGLAVAYIFMKEPVYISKGILYVQRGSLLSSLTSGRNDGFTWLTPAKETAAEINDLMKTDAFMRAVVSKTDLEEELNGGPAQIADVLEAARKAVWVRADGTNQLLVGAVHEDRLLPAQLVNAVVDNYVQWQINEDLTESIVAQEFFQDLADDYLADLNKARQELENFLVTHPEPERGERPQLEQIQIARLEGAIRLAEGRYSNSVEKDEVSRLSMTVAERSAQQAYFLIDAPEIPLGPEVSLKDLVINVAIFVTVGAIFSGAGIIGSAILDSSLRVPLDVHHNLGLPVLASLPDVTNILTLQQEETNQVKESLTLADDHTVPVRKERKAQASLVEPQPTS